MTRAVSASAGVGYATFARQHHLAFVGTFRREFLDVVDAELTEVGATWLLVDQGDQFELFTSEPLPNVLAYETMSNNERDRRLADLFRDDKTIAVALGLGE